VNVMRAKVPTPTPRRASRQRPTAAALTAFTLVELMVVMVIITILASLSLAGMAGARQRAKIDKTRATIQKIDSVIRPMFDSYRTRRITVSGTNRVTNATTVLTTKRGLMAREMPDSWDEVPSTMADYNALSASYKTAITRTYTNYRITSTGTAAPNSSPECLYLIVSRSGYEPDALENFRAQEIIDADGDGNKEFADGWGNPIAFMRWAPGFSSPVQSNAPTAQHDPLDPLNTDANAYALVPLVYSAGPDETYGLITMSVATGSGIDKKDGWTLLNLGSLCSLSVTGATDSSWNTKKAGETDPSNPTAYLDNITNHDLMKK